MTDDNLDYETLPYVSLPFPQTQPARLAGLAALRGCSVPEVQGASVLELGCASGGNLLPLAARFPDATFLGIDLAARHIREGTELISSLRLQNIRLRQGDIGTLDLKGQQFDFIICHGVFSWTPLPVQEAIFRICAETLSPDGLAYVSYNVLPGWHLRLMVREICLLDWDPQRDALTQISHARTALAAYAASLDTKTPFGKALHAEISSSLKMSDTHFQGEYLAAFNDPCTIKNFVTRAGAAGLSYVCDAGPPEEGTVSVDPLTAGETPILMQGDQLARNQAADILGGRMFRRSILRRDTDRPAPPEHRGLAELHFACGLIEEPSADHQRNFRDGTSRIRTNDPVVGRALSQLAAAYPATLTLAQLRDVASDGAGEERLVEALRRMVDAGHVVVSSEPFLSSRTDPPSLWSVALAQLAAGHVEVSSRLHEPVAMRGAVRFMAGLMDGGKSQASIVDEICAAVTNGRLSLDAPVMDQAGSVDRPRIAALLGKLVADMRRSGLLEPEAP